VENGRSKAPQPKRHHWWPQLQSGYWTGDNGLINVVKSDGSSFAASPINVGVQGELYTRFEVTGDKDVTIEQWFSTEIETPFVRALTRLISMDGLLRFRRPPVPPTKTRNASDLGFVLREDFEIMPLSSDHRKAIDSYIAALLVRNPSYLAKLVAFHDKNGVVLPPELPRNQAIKSVALNSMLEVFKLYRDVISQADLGLVVVDCDRELLFGDSGITAKEPWRSGPLPFDIHAPLTPKLALEVLPTPMPRLDRNACLIMRVNPKGVARFNRIALSDAERFIFSRGQPPVDFIRKHFGAAAPESIGLRWGGDGSGAHKARKILASLPLADFP
jgi:hypothetical protein